MKSFKVPFIHYHKSQVWEFSALISEMEKVHGHSDGRFIQLQKLIIGGKQHDFSILAKVLKSHQLKLHANLQVQNYNKSCMAQNYLQLNIFLIKHRGKPKNFFPEVSTTTVKTHAQVHVTQLKECLHMYSIILSSSYLSFLVPEEHITALQNIGTRLSESILIYLLQC